MKLPLLFHIAAPLVVTGMLLYAGSGARSRPEPMRRAYWYWHHPFRLSASESTQLREAKIERLYIHAFTLVADGKGLRLTSRQNWMPEPPVPAYAVVRVQPSAIPSLLGPGGADRASALLTEARLPNFVRGIQWDADVPTRRLPHYTAFLRQVRRRLAPGWLLSATALPDWIGSPEYARLCDSLDEIAPQFYGNRIPRPSQSVPSLWESSGIVEAVRHSVAGRARVWVGLPAYGRCIVVDPNGRAVGLRHDLDPERLTADPAWETVRSETLMRPLNRTEPRVALEDGLTLRAREVWSDGTLDVQPGTTLCFQWPRLEGLRAAESRLAGLGAEGVCFFRWPAPGELLSLHVARPAGELQLKLTREGTTTSVRVRNPGSDGPRLGDGFSLEVHPAGGELRTESQTQWLRGAEPASPLRADHAVLKRPFLRPGHDWAACEVESASGPVTATLRWTDGSGAEHQLTEVAQ